LMPGTAHAQPAQAYLAALTSVQVLRRDRPSGLIHGYS
jgi:hypothetical protein